MEVGQRIKKVREYKDFTQEYMAEQLGVSQSTYSRYEKEESDLSIPQLRKIAEILEVKIEAFFDPNEKAVFNNFAPSTTQAYIVHQSVNDKERELYEKTIKTLEDQVTLLTKILGK